MRIAILTWESLHSAAVGGVAAHTSELSAALARKGHQVHLFTRCMPNQHRHDLIEGVHYHRCSYPSHPDFVDDVNNMCRAMVDYFLEVEDLVGRFDIVHAHDWLAANAMIWIKQGRGHKGILTIHSTEYGRCGNAFTNGRSVRVRDQERAGTYWADQVIAVSKATKNEVVWMYEVPENKVNVIHNGVDCKRFDGDMDAGQEKRRYDIGPLDPTVLFCGRLVWQKGADILVEAIPRILAKYPNAKFIFAGDGDQRGALEPRTRHLGVAHAVRFLGYVNGPALVTLFKLCDAVCVPSRNEPFGIVVLEAWSAGKPVIATDIGGPKEYIRHEVDGLTISPCVDSVAWGIERVLADFEWGRCMGSNGRQALEQRFNWDEISEQTLAVYKRICGLPSGRNGAKNIDITAVPDSGAQGKVIAMSGADGHPGGGLNLEAKLRIPVHGISEDACTTLELLKIHLAASGLRPVQVDHSLEINGNWEDVTAALAAARSDLMVNAKSQGPTPRIDLRSA